MQSAYPETVTVRLPGTQQPVNQERFCGTRGILGKLTGYVPGIMLGGGYYYFKFPAEGLKEKITSIVAQGHTHFKCLCWDLNSSQPDRVS